MDKRRNKTAYLILVLLIFLVVAIIGGLVAVLFNMTSSTPPLVIQPPKLKTNVVKRITPVSETYIEADLAETKKQVEAIHSTLPTVVPAICDGYGPQIKQRDAYAHPITYRAQVQPNHVQFILYTDSKLNAKGSQ